MLYMWPRQCLKPSPLDIRVRMGSDAFDEAWPLAKNTNINHALPNNNAFSKSRSRCSFNRWNESLNDKKPTTP